MFEIKFIISYKLLCTVSWNPFYVRLSKLQKEEKKKVFCCLCQRWPWGCTNNKHADISGLLLVASYWQNYPSAAHVAVFVLFTCRCHFIDDIILLDLWKINKICGIKFMFSNSIYFENSFSCSKLFSHVERSCFLA